MQFIARGYTYKEVASELFISIKTVETHVSHVLRKLQLSNRGELALWAAHQRIVRVKLRIGTVWMYVSVQPCARCRAISNVLLSVSHSSGSAGLFVCLLSL